MTVRDIAGGLFGLSVIGGGNIWEIYGMRSFKPPSPVSLP